MKGRACAVLSNDEFDGTEPTEKEMHWMEAEELAVAVLELDEETADSAAIEQALNTRFECTFEAFHRVAAALMPLTIPAKAAISGDLFHGFVKDGAFICKQRVPSNDQGKRTGKSASF